MAQDVIYYIDVYDFVLGHIPQKAYFYSKFGEVQQGFNMSLTLDGTKDSVHFQVVSYTKNILKPYTLIQHVATSTWWVVSHDKVMRYANESGYMYVHELDCLGAIELLNARDLTDCGFRSNTYTIAEFVERLFSLSNFEFDVSIDYGSLDSTMVVDYIKTFENYTLLSALREFFNGYNCGIKLSFTHNGNVIQSAKLYVVSKTGDTSLDVIDIDNFYDIRETRTIDKNSFGTSVVTNAQNVVATKSVVFPSVGTAKLSSENRIVIDDDGDISESACIRLPTPAYKVNKLTICASNFSIQMRKNLSSFDFVTEDFYFNAYDDYALNVALNNLFDSAEDTFSSDVKDAFLEKIDEVALGIKNSTSFDLYDGFLYDAINDTNNSTTTSNPFKLPLNAPSDMKLLKFTNPAVNRDRYIVLTDKATRDSFALPYMGIYWERGSNLIKGFEYFGMDGLLDANAKIIDFNYSRNGTSIAYTLVVGEDSYTIHIVVGGSDSATIKPYNFSCIVDYVPMTDLKVITDNENVTNDIQLYNQSGKLTDSVALSKLINSYSNEITQENIVRYCDYYDFDDLPSVGQLVLDDDTYYVVNNLSLDFSLNERGGGSSYRIECEISMSKAIAVKSLMVNANSNIRDYGIPQKDNVARKQVYRNVFYLGHDNTTTGYSGYVKLEDILSFDFVPSDENRNLMAFIRCQDTYPTYSTDSEEVQSTTDYTYYQLPTTRFVLKKQVLYKLDFQDNNIIGYDSQNIASAFVVSNLNLNMIQNINTPISYVNENGKVQGINIQFDTIENTGKVYQDFADNNSLSGVTYITQRVYVNDEIYQLAQNYASFEILEDSYNKDALEIPVFEIAFQMLNSDDVVVGSNIFDTYEENKDNYRIIYGFTYVDDLALENNATSLTTNSFDYDDDLDVYSLTNACSFSFGSDNVSLLITLYDEVEFNSSGETLTLGTQKTPTQGKDIVIVKWVVDISTNTLIKKDLVFIIKNTSDMEIDDDNNIVLYINRKE